MRAGKYGEYEDRFLTDGRIYLNWQELDQSLCGLASRPALIALLETKFADSTAGKVRNHAAQIWAFLREMEPGDLVVVPSKKAPEFHFGTITGPCAYQEDSPLGYRHSRTVQWLKRVPRTTLDKDLLYSLGAIMTICRISRNDAEARIRHLLHQTSPANIPNMATELGGAEAVSRIDYEQLARDEIATLILRKFKGHGLERLVNAILQAQGYVTFHSPAGADKGVDILAGSGPLGFGSPRICVQVKSEQTPVDHPTFSQLLGTMQAVGAEQGLLVSWGGFKSSVEKEVPRHFFKVRLWDQTALLNQFFEHYDRLDEEIRAEIPLKKIWTLVPDDMDEEP